MQYKINKVEVLKQRIAVLEKQKNDAEAFAEGLMNKSGVEVVRVCCGRNSVQGLMEKKLCNAISKIKELAESNKSCGSVRI